MDTIMESTLWERYGKLLDLHPVSINVRRGDYLQVSDCHPVQTMEYFRTEIEYMGKDRHFLITSDDTEWCKENFIGEKMHIVEDVDPVENLYLQSMCMDHIISNSTYSWWGAWLDDKQDYICKKRVNELSSTLFFSSFKKGGYLLSHGCAVPSAWTGLTSLFGMGRGGTPSL